MLGTYVQRIVFGQTANNLQMFHNLTDLAWFEVDLACVLA